MTLRSIITSLLLMECIVLLVGAIINLYVLDNLVNGTLYNYGLQFSYSWANDYWFSMRLALAQIAGVIVSLVLLSIVMIKKKKRIVNEA